MSAEATQEQASHEELLAACRHQLIEDGLMTCEDGQYFISEKGTQLVGKELQRYQMMPARYVLIEQYILQIHGLTVG